MSKTKDQESIVASPHIATAKIFSCESLSGRCVLQAAIGYEVGTKDRLYIKITASDGQGKFNACWWSLADIENALSKVPEHEAFTPAVLAPVFAGRSVNTMFFVISALASLGLLRRADPVENGYVRNVPVEFLKELQTLIQGGTDLLPPSMGQGVGHIAVKATKAAAEVKKSPKKTVAPAAV
jgi:hypothetical protein